MSAAEGATSTTGRSEGGSRGRGRGGGGGGGGGGRGNQGQNRGGAKRGGGRGGNARGQGRGQKGTEAAAATSAEEAAAANKENKALAATAPKLQADDDDEEDGDVCFICANPVAHHSIAPCNHKTCHICGLRMRALYKTKDCAHCRTPAAYVIFTDDADKKFQAYTDSDFTSTDSSIGIKYTNEEIVGDTVLLLRYNCPDGSCDFAGLGWADLHRHVKSAHRKRMCDLCTRNKKVFTHEHELFTDKELERHMRHGDDKPGAADQTGFKGHPLCGFCGERFYDDDKLFEHCRMKHERCFICDRRDSRQPHYFLNYDELEKHFKKDHYLCPDRGCLEKKFVVFESELDMQAHHLAEHAGKHVGRDARLVDISAFDIRQSYQPERRGGGGAASGSQGEGRSRARARGNRGRDPNEDSILPTVTSAQPLRRDEIAFQRQMAIASAPAGSNRTFRGQLSAPAPAATTSSSPATPTLAPTPAQASSTRNAAATTSRPRSVGPGTGPAPPTDGMEALSLTDTSNLSAEERARLVRHGSVIERAANLLGNDSHKMATFRSHISTYRQGGLTAPQLVEAFFTLFADVSSNALGILVRELADLFDDKSKADGLRKAWQDWRAINEDYPSLPGLGGMQGATSSSSGWASAAAANTGFTIVAPGQRNSTRVLKLKNSTRLGGPAPNTSRGPPGWVPASSSSSRASSSSKAPSSSAFPSLPPPSSSSSSSTAARVSAATSAPSWTASSSSSTTRSRGPPPPNTRAEDAFPALPAAPKPQTTIFGYGKGRGVRRDFGQQESNFQWGATPASSSSAAAQPEPADDGEATEGKGKKGGKKNKKQILVQWG